MSAQLPLGLRNPYTPCAPPCTCVQQRVHDAWKEGAMAGARAVIARMRDLHKESIGFETADGAAAKLEHELKGET